MSLLLLYNLNLTNPIPPPTLTITTSSPLPSGTVGIAYVDTLTATGGVTPYTWALQTGVLPSGISLSSGGVISGTPSSSGTFNFTVQVTDHVGTIAPAPLSLTVASVSNLNITSPSSLPRGIVCKNYTVCLKATGGVLPYTWSLQSGTLPPGLTLFPSTGFIKGSTTTLGTSNFTILVTDAVGQTKAKGFQIQVKKN